MFMKVSLTPSAQSFLKAKGADAITVSSLVFSSCCSPPLPPEVTVGPPAHPDGFTAVAVEGLTLFFDSLLEPRPQLIIDLKEYERYQELVVQGWE
jgi:hypothetical protein